MEDKKLLKNIYYVLSLMCYIVAILFFAKSSSNGMGVLWLLFGSTCLYFATTFNKKNKDDNL